MSDSSKWWAEMTEAHWRGRSETPPNSGPGRTVCLTLDRREADRGRIRSEFSGLVSDDVEFFWAGDGSYDVPYGHIDVKPPERRGSGSWFERPNSYNAFLCFRKIVAKAKEDGIGRLLLLEDDAAMADRELAEEGLRWADANPGWLMFYLGANHSSAVTVEVTKHVLRVSGSWCFHSVILNNSVFDDILNLPVICPIDYMAARLIHPMGRCYSVWPSAAIQTPGLSHCDGVEADYTELFLSKGHCEARR